MAKWDSAKAAALKILGKSGDVPEMPDIVQKAADTMGKANDDFDKSRTDCEAKLLALQNANDAVRNSLKQFAAKIERADLGLDSRNKDDIKKIQQARKFLMDTLNAGVKFYNDDDRMLDEVDKHLVQLGKYQPKPNPL